MHHKVTLACAAGYKAPLAVGLLKASLLASYATDMPIAEAVRRFPNRVWPGGSVTWSGTLVRHYKQNSRLLVDVELACVSQVGVVAVQAWAAFVPSPA
jgi:hypothetical protein